MGLLTRPIIALRRWGASDTAGRIRSFLPRPLRSLLHRVRKSLACIPLRIVLPVLPRQTAPVRVVIFGTFAGNWLDRLADPQAWRACPAVREVVLWPDDPARPFPEPLPGDIRTVVIPLSEDNVIGRPLSLAGLAPDGRAVAILRNKASFAAYVRAEGLDHLCPVTYATRGQVAFPCIVKYVNAAFAFGSRILRSDCELDDCCVANHGTAARSSSSRSSKARSNTRPSASAVPAAPCGPPPSPSKTKKGSRSGAASPSGP